MHAILRLLVAVVIYRGVLVLGIIGCALLAVEEPAVVA